MTHFENKIFKQLLTEQDHDENIIIEQEKFLKKIWGNSKKSDEVSFVGFAFRHHKNMKFVEKFLKTDNLKGLRRLLDRYNRWEYDQYFCPNTFTKASRQKQFAMSTQLAWSDIDEEDYSKFRPHPSIVWETSPKRTQALWLWGKKYSPEKAESFSRSLTYRHHGDKSGWPINKLLRIPGSINHKQEYDRPFIPLVHCDLRPILRRPRPYKIKGRNYTSSTSTFNMNHKAHKKSEVFKKYSSWLDGTARLLIKHNEVVAPDRSLRIYQIVASLHEAGATLDEIASVLWDSPYFQEKYPNNLNALHNEVSRILAKIGVKS